MDGNISKEVIKLDLESMECVGIGGFQNFDASLTTPKLVDRRLVYMTPEGLQRSVCAARLLRSTESRHRWRSVFAQLRFFACLGNLSLVKQSLRR